MELVEAKNIFYAAKRLVTPITWNKVPNRDHKDAKEQVFCRVVINGTIRQGLIFRITILPNFPDTFTILLSSEQTLKQKHLILYRLDVNPLSIHTNPMDAWHPLKGHRFNSCETHEHLFLDNTTSDQLRIKASSDAYARKIADPPTTLEESLEYIGNKLNIENYSDIPIPNVQGLLL